MARAPFQVIVIPFRVDLHGQAQFLVFRRADCDAWQWIAGGGEGDEKPAQTARREAFEEAGIAAAARLIRLDSRASIPAEHFSDRHLWGANVYVVTEYSFGIEIGGDEEITLSNEHCECAWLSGESALGRLKWDSNKTALWELSRRLAVNSKR